MLKDQPVLACQDEEVTIFLRDLLPLELKAKTKLQHSDVVQWGSNRVFQIEREHAKTMLHVLDLSPKQRWQIALACKALSLMDCYWLKVEESTDTWVSVNFYHNPFCEELGLVAFTGNYTGSFIVRYDTPELTTQGAYAKCWRRENGQLYMYKANTAQGKESEAEYIVSELLSEAKLAHVCYELTTFQGKTASRCINYCNENTSIIPFAHFDTFANIKGKDSLKLVEEMYPEAFRQMLVIDYIIDNVDRHSFNWGFQVDAHTCNVMGLHPLMDHNCAMTFANSQALSITYTGMTLQYVARRAYRKLEDTSFVHNILDYVNRWGTKKAFQKLFGTDHQWTNVKARCEELLRVVKWPHM